jgi:hypothetical protein
LKPDFLIISKSSDPTRRRLVALEKAKAEKEAHGEFDSECRAIARPSTPSILAAS